MNPTKVDRNEIFKKLNLGVKNVPYKNKTHEEIEKSKLIDKLNDKEYIHKQKYSDTEIDKLDINSVALLPSTSFVSKKYIYKINDVLSNKETETLVTNKLVHICIFNIIEQSSGLPFILYLLNKDIKSNILYFPHFYTSESIYIQADNHIKDMFKDLTISVNFKGHIESNNNIYLFYEAKYNYSLIKHSYKDIWWWTSMFEIINTKMILNFPIHDSVSKIFYNNPLLMVLLDEKNNKIPSPYIGYYGGYYTYISFISVFGLPKQSPEANLGPYYYFYTYKGAGRGAIWAYTRKTTIMNGEEITRDGTGIHKLGGLVRFAIFNQTNLKYLLNRETDKDDDSQITKDLINDTEKEKQALGKFIKSTIKVRDVDGKWADNHDLVYIGSVLIKSDIYKDRKLDIQFAVRDFNQQLPLTYHYVDTTEFSKVEGTSHQRNLPYDYIDYNIK